MRYTCNLHVACGNMPRHVFFNFLFSTGGIGEAVCAVVVGEPGITVNCLAVSHVPRSGKSPELLKMFGIDKDAIVQAVKVSVSKSRNAE